MYPFALSAVSRAAVGKGSSRRLRNEGLIPATVYGGGRASCSVAVKHDSFWNMLSANERILTSVLSLDVDGSEEAVIIKDLQRHSYANKILHIDFQRIDHSRPIVKSVPLEFTNVQLSPGVRRGALLTPLMATLGVRCLPADLPASISVDCSALEGGASVKMSEIDLPPNVELTALRRGGEEYDHAVLVLGKVSS